MNNARLYCEQWDMLNKLHKLSNNGPIELLLKHGVELAARRPAPWRGTPKACYANAQYLVKRRKNLRYFEGYAVYRIPVEHAWCVDETGQVVDPTWEETSETSPEYFGIGFDMDLVRQIRKLPGGHSYSVLFTWWKWAKIYPLLCGYLEANCNLTTDVIK